MSATRVLRSVRGGGRRRGSALVFVLFFGVAAMVLVTMLFTATTTNIRAEHETHRQHGLQSVVRVGLATAVNEINRFRKNPSTAQDPGGDGPGALTGGTGFPGVPVFENPNGTGRVLGFYRATVDPATNVLTVLAAWPDFTNPRQFASGRVVLGRNTRMFPSNPFSIVANNAQAGGTAAKFEVGGAAKFKVDGQDGYTDPLKAFDVPAIEISNAYMHNYATTAPGTVVSNAALLTGLDTTGAVVNGGGTVVNQGNTTMDDGVLDKMAQQFDSFVAQHDTAGVNQTLALKAEILAINAGAFNAAETVLDKAVTLPVDDTKVYVLPSDLEIKKDLEGWGTLVITDDLKIANGATLTWHGKVIVQHPTSTVNVKVDGRMRVQRSTTGEPGLFVVQSDDQGSGDANLDLGPGGGSNNTLEVDGGLFILSDHSSDFQISSGAKIQVTGIFGLLGQGFDLTFGSGSKLEVTGSMVVAVPDGASQGINQINFDKGDHEFKWESNEFTGVQSAFAEFADPNNEILPLRILGYWEPKVRGTGGVLAEQQAALASGDYAYGD